MQGGIKGISIFIDAAREFWRSKGSRIPLNFVELIESIEETVKSLILFVTSTEANKVFRESAMENLNAPLICLEEHVGGDYNKAIGEDLPTVSIAIKELLHLLNEHVRDVEKIEAVAIETRDLMLTPCERKEECGWIPCKKNYVYRQGHAASDGSSFAMKNQSGTENMVVELGGDILRGEQMYVLGWRSICLPATLWYFCGH
eukprot:14611455-Ditylum_brightwellii.AAC.1